MHVLHVSFAIYEQIQRIVELSTTGILHNQQKQQQQQQQQVSGSSITVPKKLLEMVAKKLNVHDGSMNSSRLLISQTTEAESPSVREENVELSSEQILSLFISLFSPLRQTGNMASTPSASASTSSADLSASNLATNSTQIGQASSSTNNSGTNNSSNKLSSLDIDGDYMDDTPLNDESIDEEKEVSRIYSIDEDVEEVSYEGEQSQPRNVSAEVSPQVILSGKS